MLDRLVHRFVARWTQISAPSRSHAECVKYTTDTLVCKVICLVRHCRDVLTFRVVTNFGKHKVDPKYKTILEAGTFLS